MKPSLCLNMIVKNEAARIERCLKSVLPYVKSAAILDTGSTDNTVALIEALCREHDVPFIVESGSFVDFSQARNEAFVLAQQVNGRMQMPWCQFALLMDADMELSVSDTTDAFASLDATAFSYDMMQTGGAVTYANRRLINLERSHSKPYAGVTHEYIDLPAFGMIEGARFIDHADGANRKDKYQRDADLLTHALKTDPNNGRYLYYLGNTYRDWGKPDRAIRTYKRRIELGGWDEETHNAMMHLSGARKDVGDIPGFVAGMIEAFNFRPSRAEPLYDLAKHFREAGQPRSALVFAKAGVNIKRPNDLLFVNDFVYSHGLRYEYSIAAFYDETERARAFEITNDLALDPTCPAIERESACCNLFWYLKPLSHYCPSFNGKKIDFEPPAGYQAMNPSVTEHNGELVCNIRCVNYKINEHGQYMIGPLSCNDAPIETRNFLVWLDERLNSRLPLEIIWRRPDPAWDRVIGLEDIRLNTIGTQLCFSATIREQLASGQCQMVRGGLRTAEGCMETEYWDQLSDGASCQKNWAPFQGLPKWMYEPGVIATTDRNTLTVEAGASLHTSNLRGSSQLVPFKNGWLAIVHEAIMLSGGKRVYWHRFVWYDNDGALYRVSKPFVFYETQIEFCAGLAWHPESSDLVISFGVRDAEAHIATVDATEVSRMLSMYWDVK